MYPLAIGQTGGAMTGHAKTNGKRARRAASPSKGRERMVVGGEVQYLRPHVARMVRNLRKLKGVLV